MILKLNNFVYKFLSISLFFLPIQACLVVLFNFPNSIQYFYLFIIIGFITSIVITLKYKKISIDKTFIILFLLLLFSMFISFIINYEQILSKGMEFAYFVSVYSKFWDSPDIRMFNWGILRPFLFFLYACILFLFFNLKYGLKIAFKTILTLAIISCIYSIYQIVAAYFNLPGGAIFSGHHGQEIFLFGKLRRVEGLFYEPGPQATFLSPIFCIMFFQLFERNKEKMLYTPKKTYLIFILIAIVTVCTFSPIAFLTIPICIGLAYILNYKRIKFKLTTKNIKILYCVVIFLVMLILGIFNLIQKNAQNFSISKYMIEKILVSTTSFDSPVVYLNPDSRSVRSFVGIELFKDHKIFGAGPSSAITYFFKYANFTSNKYILRDQHAVINTHIKMLCEYGLVGFFFYLLLLLYPIYLYIKYFKLLKDNKNIIDSLFISYLIYILVSFQATLQFWMPYFWVIYVMLVVLLKKCPLQYIKMENNLK